MKAVPTRPRNVGLLALGLAALLLAACAGQPQAQAGNAGLAAPDQPPALPPASAEAKVPIGPTFMVLSDLHLFDPSLGTSGPSWDAQMKGSRKLLKDSEELLELAFARVVAAKPAFILVTGDLTKDGERPCHELLARHLEALAAAGIPSYVLPGNHDIANSKAERYLPSGGTEALPSIMASDFAAIYKDSGYGRALYRDPASLSYVAAPLPGLWLLALDTCIYRSDDGKGRSMTGGAIHPASWPWIEKVLVAAKEAGATVIAAGHHPVMEHFYGMKAGFPNYVIGDNARLAVLLVSHGVRYYFSGHFHASSIALTRVPGADPRDPASRSLIDIETASLVSWPCSYRTVTLGADGSLGITTDPISELPSYAASGRDFGQAAKAANYASLSITLASALRKALLGTQDIGLLLPHLVEASLAYYAGDARFEGDDPLPAAGLSLAGRLVASTLRPAVLGLWKLKLPKGVELLADNNVVLHADGSWEPLP
jgi:hypothetical protein